MIFNNFGTCICLSWHVNIPIMIVQNRLVNNSLKSLSIHFLGQKHWISRFSPVGLLGVS